MITLDDARRARLMRVLRERLLRHRTADQMYDEACEVLREQLGPHALQSIYIADGGVLWLRAQRGYGQVINLLPMDRGGFGLAYTSQEVVHMGAGAATDERFILAADGIDAMIAVPFTEGILDGLLGFESTAPLTADLIDPLVEVAAVIEHAVATLPEPERRLTSGRRRLARAFLRIADTRDPVAVHELAARTIGELLDLDCVQTADLVGGELQPAAMWHRYDDRRDFLSVDSFRALARDFNHGPVSTQGVDGALVAQARRLRDEGVARMAGLPLLASGHLVGYVVGTSPSGDTVDQERFHEAELVAMHTASTLEGLRALDRSREAERALEERARRQALLAALGQKALEGRPTVEIAGAAAVHLSETLEAPFVSMFEVTAGGDEIEMRVAHGRSRSLVGKRLPVEPGSAAEFVMASRAPIVVVDLATDPRFTPPPTLDGLGIVSALAVPLRSAGATFGAINLFWQTERDFTQEDVHFAQSAANMVAAALAAERAAAALTESERHRVEVLSEMLTAGDRERARIATELHDDTVQVMAATLVTLDRLTARLGGDADPDLLAAYDAVRTTLREAMDRTRRLMFDLRPPLLEAYGLEPALRDLLLQAGTQGGFDTASEISVGRHPEPVEVLTYRTVREAVINARRHSGAGLLELRLGDADGVIRGWVVDDGVGFDVDHVLQRGRSRLNLGLEAMMERVRLAGGDVVIDSAPGRGTTLRFEIPAAA